MKLAFTDEGVGLLDGDTVALLDVPPGEVASLLGAADGSATLREAPVRRHVPVDQLRLVACVPGSPSVWIVGTNYASKLRVMNRPTPSAPFFALKASSSVGHPDSEVTLPPTHPAQVDYEGEMGVVISRTTHRVAVDDAWACVAGLTACNDVSARDLMDGGRGVATAKSFPGFCPVGSVLVTPDEYGDRDDVGLRTFVSGELRQSTRTSELVFPVAEIVSRLSHFAVLRPGDLVCTGSPAGSGQDDGRFLEPDDVVVVELEGAPPLQTTFVRAGEGRP